MFKQTYVIIEANPDGDSYEIHNQLEEAKKSFEERKSTSSIWAEGTIYLVEVKDKKFGFGSMGDIYGADVIEQHELES